MQGLDLEWETAKTSLQEEAKMKVQKSLEVFGSWVNTFGACQDSLVLSGDGKNIYNHTIAMSHRGRTEI